MRNTLLLLIFLASCKGTNPKSDSQTLDFGAFTIQTPTSWTKIKEKGFDSYVGRIALDETDTIEFDLGWYSNTLTESDPVIMERSILKNLIQPIDTSEIIIVENRKGIDPDKYKKNNISWDTIDGYKAKIIFPRKSGSGTTGIYIDSLWRAGSDIDKFNLYGINLKPANEKEFLKALRTLKFNRKK